MLSFFALRFDLKGILVVILVQFHFPTDEETKAQQAWTLGNFPKYKVFGEWERKPGWPLSSQLDKESPYSHKKKCTLFLMR